MRRFSLAALPVVDSKGALVGIVTAGEAMDIAEKETTEDFQKKSAIIPLELSYSSASVWSMYRKRIVWLSLLGVAGFLTSRVKSAFEKTIASMVVVASFMPVLADSGGNTGTQSATLVIRALAVGDIALKNWFSVLRREAAVGVMLGVSLGAILFCTAFVWRGGAMVGVVIFLSLTCVMIWANLVGGLLPIIFTKIKIDPAVAGNPAITTLVDATGLLIYFSIAKMVLGL